jgi:hypothetical protein
MHASLFISHLGTGVEKFVVNLHWTTQNVNITLDMAHENSDSVMVDSKDAKAAIQSDVSPVQKAGKTWKKIELPDHDWQRTTQNTVTPMTHLFIKTSSIHLEDNTLSITRSGIPATTLNLTFFEPHTVQRVFNDLFLLLVNPSLDSVFRNPQTGRLKEHFVFVVDNEPAEAPSSPMVALWLLRLARMLQLKSVTQKSFAITANAIQLNVCMLSTIQPCPMRFFQVMVSMINIKLETQGTTKIWNSWLKK